MDYFEKKQWIRIAVCAVLVIAAVLAVTGVLNGNQPLTYDPAARNIPAGAVTVEATEKGFGGDVTVHVSMDDQYKVLALSIDTPDETEGLGKRVSDTEFTDQFIGKTGLFAFGTDGIEAISGASVTSNAALKAINKAMNQNEESLEETAKQEAEPEPEAPETAETTETPEATVTADEVTASEQGFGGDVTVHATLDGDTLKTLAIDTPNETAGLGQRASEAEFTGQFIGKAGPFTYGENGIEALSGATVTSNAALKAINSLFGGGETAEGKEPETAPEATEAPKAETETEKTDETAEGAYAVYRSTKQNNFSKITVIASANGDKLSDVKIISSGEEGMDLLTDAIKEEWAKAILESGSAAPDAITGATLQYSAGSVTEAMTEILDRMAGKETEAAPEVTEAPTEAPAEEPAEEPTEAPTELPTEEPAPEATEGPAGEEPAKEAPAYAGYRAEAENDFSKVIIIAYAKKGKLASVKILSEEKEGQKDLMTDEIREAWAKAILESGSAAPDAITGATLKISAGSVTEAMTKILEQMAGK